MEGALQKVVGENLKRYRQSMGWSQEKLAEELGVHRTYAGGLERGERNLSLKSVERIADTLGLDPITLLTALDSHS